MSATVPIALFGVIPLVLCLFAVLSPRRAVSVSFVIAWLFLPMAGYGFEGFPDYTKVSATCIGVLLAASIFDTDRLLAFRPRWFDLPVIVLCLSPFITSLTNGLGAYDGVSAVIGQLFLWGFPYFIGRVYYSNLAGLRELAMAVFVGGLIYVPLCLFEIRMSPQLHRMVYGFHQHSFAQHMRYGGYRPMVFMQHGLMVAFWMMTASIVGLWLWLTGAVKEVWGIRAGWLVMALLVTTVLCKSAGAMALLLMGGGLFYALKKTRTTIPVIILVSLPLVYMTARQTQVADRHLISTAIRPVLNDRQWQSLGARLIQEDVLSEKSWRRPVFGWGRWNRMRPTDPAAQRKMRAVDSLWTQMFGTYGLVGLASVTAMVLLPIIVLLRKVNGRFWTHPKYAAPAALCVVLGLYMCDNMMNSMENPVFILAAGGLTGWLIRQTVTSAAREKRERGPAWNFAAKTTPALQETGR